MEVVTKGKSAAAKSQVPEVAVERAVTRLMKAGRTRYAALMLMADKLNDAISSVQVAGFGETSRLRTLLMTTVTKIDECRQEGESEDDDTYV